MKRCKDCKYEYLFSYCSRDKKEKEQKRNPFTNVQPDYGIHRDTNIEGTCPHYIRVWWKFWREK